MLITTKIKELQYFEKFEEIFVLSLLIFFTNVAVKLICDALAERARKNPQGGPDSVDHAPPELEPYSHAFNCFHRSLKEMQPMTCFKLTFAACVCAAMVGCGNDSGTDADKGKSAAAPAKTAEVVIYTNADEEAQTAMKNALDKNGMKGAYLIQSFGTSELGGKLAAEGKNIEADVVTLSTYYLDSFQKKEKLFADLQNKAKTIQPSPSYWTPILGNTGALFVNTEVLKQSKLEAPKSIADLAKPEYAGHISVPDIMGSSTSWLMTQAVMSAQGEEGWRQDDRRD